MNVHDGIDTDTLITAEQETNIHRQINSMKEPECESEHNKTACSGSVVWVRPQDPCGHRPVQLVCQSVHDYVFLSRSSRMRCTVCWQSWPIEEFRKGWRPV